MRASLFTILRGSFLGTRGNRKPWAEHSCGLALLASVQDFQLHPEKQVDLGLGANLGLRPEERPQACLALPAGCAEPWARTRSAAGAERGLSEAARWPPPTPPPAAPLPFPVPRRHPRKGRDSPAQTPVPLPAQPAPLCGGPRSAPET